MSKCLQCAAVYMLAKAAAEGAKAELERGGLPRGEYAYLKGQYEASRKILKALGDDPGKLETGKRHGLIEVLDRMFSL